MVTLTRVVELLSQPGECLGVPVEVVVVVIVRSVNDGVVTVPQDTLQVTGHQAVVLVPETLRGDVGGGRGSGASLSYQIPPVLTLPPSSRYQTFISY